MDLQTIRTRVRQRLDELTASLWTDAELNAYINDSYFYYWQWLIEAKNPGTMKVSSLNIVNGQENIALPADFIEARLVEKVVSNFTVPLVYYERMDEINYTTGSPAPGSLGFRYNYRFVGPNLVLEPTPQETVANGIKLTYLFQPAELVNNGDVPNTALKALFHNLLVLKSVISAKEKEEMIGGGGADTVPFVSTLSQLEQKFKESIEPPTMMRQYTSPFVTGCGL